MVILCCCYYNTFYTESSLIMSHWFSCHGRAAYATYSTADQSGGIHNAIVLLVVSLVARPSRSHVNNAHVINFYSTIMRRSGQYDDKMMMSGGHEVRWSSLALNFLDIKCLLPTHAYGTRALA